MTLIEQAEKTLDQEQALKAAGTLTGQRRVTVVTADRLLAAQVAKAGPTVGAT